MSVDDSLLKSGQIEENTVPLTVVFQGIEKQEQFDIIQVPSFKIILGMPWLVKWNPAIDWKTRTVKIEATEKRYVNAITDRYPDLVTVFDKKEADVLPPHREYDCRIDLVPNTSVPHGRIYALSPKEDNILKDYIKDNLEKGFIRPSSSPAGAPLFFVSKKDTEELRPCIDYRLLNLITIKNRYPLPLIPVLLDQIQDASIFSKIDLRGAYNLVRMREGDEWKTAFRTAHGHYEYLVMPFGLCNAPACFQYFVNDVFRDILNTFMVIYLDDILIFSQNEDEHARHVRIVLEKLLHNRLYAKETKCLFFQRQVPFLGFLISHQGREMDPVKIQAIVQWEAPQTIKDVQRFLGFANFYRQYIPAYSDIVLPLTRALKKKGFLWGNEQQEAFEVLKKEFTKAPVLIHPDFTKPFIIEADASSNAIGAVLSQKDTLQETHPVAYYSRKLNPAERNYTIYEKELLAIKEALKQWRHYLEGTEIRSLSSQITRT